MRYQEPVTAYGPWRADALSLGPTFRVRTPGFLVDLRLLPDEHRKLFVPAVHENLRPARCRAAAAGQDQRSCARVSAETPGAIADGFSGVWRHRPLGRHCYQAPDEVIEATPEIPWREVVRAVAY